MPCNKSGKYQFKINRGENSILKKSNVSNFSKYKEKLNIIVDFDNYLDQTLIKSENTVSKKSLICNFRERCIHSQRSVNSKKQQEVTESYMNKTYNQKFRSKDMDSSKEYLKTN